MPTDHACQSAADEVARGLTPLRDRLGASHGSGGGLGRHHAAPADGAAALLTFLDGLCAELNGGLTGWHATAGHRLLDALGLPRAGVAPPAAGGRSAAGGPYGWDALALVRHRAEEILTALSDRSRAGPAGGPIGGAHLPSRLDVVQDALAGALHRLGVPPADSAHCAGELATAAGSLFGVHPVPRRGVPEPPPTTRTEPPAPPVVAMPGMGDWAGGGMP
ncbi:hypothetical protein ACFYOV_13860 [Streptomyces sp. NPDC005931]|uniref:hypothetical protein n=1 Tax=Streptomyces sp. NPDC005931 TaxID=3364737 RepID=UPI0036B7AA77